VKTFSRDCLHVQFNIGADKPLNIFINHLKSQGYSGRNDPSGNIRRAGQSKRVAEIISELDLNEDYIVVAGDLNSDPKNPSLAPLLNNADLFNLNLKLPSGDRGTYMNGKQQLDYIIVSRPLEQRFQNLHIERKGIFSKTKEHYDTVISRTTEASDHAAVVAEFNF
jgi:endonuclease/exonuclease/phosphatase family metal-dependent hydrolase